MEDAAKRHGCRPVQIVIDSTRSITTHGFATHRGGPAIIANPESVEAAQASGQNGELTCYTLERFFSHEFAHAAQPATTAKGEASRVIMLGAGLSKVNNSRLYR